jgi:S1-C subfamily serine protease
MKKNLSSSFRTTFSVLLVGTVSILCSYFLSQVDIPKHNQHYSIIEAITPSIVLVLDKTIVTGAGIIVDSQKGLILTSKHLVTSTSQIMLQDKQIYSITHFYPDKMRDLALVQITPNTHFSLLPSARFVSTMNHLERGDSVISFGALSLSQSIALSQ